MSEFNPSDDSTWNYTMKAEDHAALQRLQSEKRHLIGRDDDVLNGLYGGDYGGEVIVVDYDRNGDYYDSLVDTVIASSTNSSGKIDKSALLGNVYELVKSILPYSQNKVDLVNTRYKIGDYDKISLTVYAKEGAGVCRHQALLAKTILEIMHNKGIIRGNASIDRNIQWTEQGDRGGHAWVRYTNSAGRVYIIDVAQNFIGSLEESQKLKSGWNYLRPSDKKSNQQPNMKQDLGAVSRHALIEVPQEWVVK